MNHWRPSASLQNLRLRAAIFKKIRDFFENHQILEVETPLLCSTSVTDPFIQSITTTSPIPSLQQKFYLQTSPEYCMKRLLAAGSGSIYQICKAFRKAEIGQHHNPEFTLLEWYRLGFNHHDLMDEVDEFFQYLLQTYPAKRVGYKELFHHYLGINPHTATVNELLQCAQKNNLNLAKEPQDIDTCLQLLMSHCIEPNLGQNNQPYFVYDFPSSQAALARIQPGHPPVAARFEAYLQGMELANGFYELKNVAEQRHRFEKNLHERQKLNLPFLPIDENFLAALHEGLPDCAGVALGIDRLIMIATQSTHIRNVISFDISRV